MIVPSWPEARSPGPSGPDRFSPMGGRAPRAARTSADMWASCQRISSSTASGLSGAAKPAASAAYPAAPSACAPMWQTPTAWPADLAAATAPGDFTSSAPTPPTKRRRISSAVLSSPRAKARARAMSTRGRWSSGTSVSKRPSTRSAQSAAHPATRRRSASLSVCGDRPILVQASAADPANLVDLSVANPEGRFSSWSFSGPGQVRTNTDEGSRPGGCIGQGLGLPVRQVCTPKVRAGPEPPPPSMGVLRASLRMHRPLTSMSGRRLLCFWGQFVGTYSALAYAACAGWRERERPVRCAFATEASVG